MLKCVFDRVSMFAAAAKLSPWYPCDVPIIW
jgi:hypothetical protein